MSDFKDAELSTLSSPRELEIDMNWRKRRDLQEMAKYRQAWHDLAEGKWSNSKIKCRTRNCIEMQ